MNADKHSKNLDELISGAISRDKPQFDFNKWKRIHQNKIQIFESQTTGGKALRSTEPPNIWRTIMKSRITGIAAAAAVIVSIVVGVTLLDRSAAPAYAIEQTIQAMRSVSSVRAYCTDWDGSKGEVWVQVDPETGQEEYYYADQGNLLIVATPKKTYYYHRDKNLVRIRNEYVPAAEVRFSRLFEDLTDFVQKLNGKLEFQSEFDQDLQKEVIRVHVCLPAQPQRNFGGKEFIITVDPKTKLPISTETIEGTPGQGVKSVDRFEYNVPIPQGLFDFEIPEGAEVIHE
jgi:outer membrane lipoprotein-sorting protein